MDSHYCKCISVVTLNAAALYTLSLLVANGQWPERLQQPACMPNLPYSQGLYNEAKQSI